MNLLLTLNPSDTLSRIMADLLAIPRDQRHTVRFVTREPWPTPTFLGYPVEVRP